MSSSHIQNATGRQREYADIPASTIIIPGNDRILLREDTLKKAANLLSRQWGRKLTAEEVQSFISYVTHILPTSFHNLTYAASVGKMVDGYTRQRANLAAGRQSDLVLEADSNSHLSGVDEDTNVGTVSDYLRKEVAQFTEDENQFKLTAHADRRGNAIIDRPRVYHERSSPHSLLPAAPMPTMPGSTSDGGAMGMVTAASSAMAAEVAKMSHLFNQFLMPESTEKMFTRLQSSWTNIHNINLIHQTVQFDTRNRLQGFGGLTRFRWNIHTANYPGKLGDIRIQDTLQQIINMKIYPFWMPVPSDPSTVLAIDTYKKVRMVIEEYSSQAVTVTEFNDATQNVPTSELYHFEFDISATVGSRMFLTPIGEFRFRKPLAKILDTVTVSFRVPFATEVFDADSGIFMVTYGNPTLFTAVSPSTFNLNSGDLVYVYNVNSPNAAINAALDNPSGLPITKLSTSQFTLPVDSSAVAGSASGINIYFAPKRMFFQIEFTSLEQ